MYSTQQANKELLHHTTGARAQSSHHTRTSSLEIRLSWAQEGHKRVTALPSRATALWAGLRDHPRPATADTAQEPQLLQNSSNRSHRTTPPGFVSLQNLQAYLQKRHRMLTGCLSTKKGTEKFWLKA